MTSLTVTLAVSVCFTGRVDGQLLQLLVDWPRPEGFLPLLDPLKVGLTLPICVRRRRSVRSVDRRRGRGRRGHCWHCREVRSDKIAFKFSKNKLRIDAILSKQMETKTTEISSWITDVNSLSWFEQSWPQNSTDIAQLKFLVFLGISNFFSYLII